MSGETKAFGYLVHLGSQKLAVAEMCISKNVVEPVMVGLRCMFKIISLKIY